MSNTAEKTVSIVYITEDKRASRVVKVFENESDAETYVSCVNDANSIYYGHPVDELEKFGLPFYYVSGIELS